MPSKTTTLYLVLAIALLSSLLAFQNCAGRKSEGSTVSASACVASSVLREAYPSGHTFSLPQGVSNTPYSCINQSGYSSLVFNATNQTLTFQGSSGSLVVSLVTGGSPCGAHNTQGGDNWRGTTGLGADTVLSASTLQLTTTDSRISCTISR